MKKLISSLFITLFLLFILLAFTTTAFGARYKTQALLKVLPYPEEDPMSLESPPIDLAVQNRFCDSMVELAQQQSLLTDLLKRDAIRETDWFKKFGRTSDGISPAVSIDRAFTDLRNNLNIYRKKDSDFIIISMACDDRRETALIANEFADVFIKSRQIYKGKQITNKLIAANESKTSIVRELSAIQTVLNDLRAETGFYDFEQNGFPHPIRVRLNRLLAKKDDCILEFTEIESKIRILQKGGEKTEEEQKQLDEAQNELQIKREQLNKLEKMCQEAKETKRDFDLAHARYQDMEEKRIDITERLRKINSLIENLRLKQLNPDIVKVQIVEEAPIP